MDVWPGVSRELQCAFERVDRAHAGTTNVNSFNSRFGFRYWMVISDYAEADTPQGARERRSSQACAQTL